MFHMENNIHEVSSLYFIQAILRIHCSFQQNTYMHQEMIYITHIPLPTSLIRSATPTNLHWPLFTFASCFENGGGMGGSACFNGIWELMNPNIPINHIENMIVILTSIYQKSEVINRSFTTVVCSTNKWIVACHFSVGKGFVLQDVLCSCCYTWPISEHKSWLETNTHN